MLGLDEFRRAYPGMVVRPTADAQLLRLVGEFAFAAEAPRLPRIDDVYELELRIPLDFPHQLPRVFECGERIPADFHRYADGSLCLGSRLRLYCEVAQERSLLGYAQRCLIPYLYGWSYRERFGALPWGDLEHGHKAALGDYCQLLDAPDRESCFGLVHMLSLRLRVANKRPCPCRSGQRLGRCHNRRLNPMRLVPTRAWFRKEHYAIKAELDLSRPVRKTLDF